MPVAEFENSIFQQTDYRNKNFLSKRILCLVRDQESVRTGVRKYAKSDSLGDFAAFAGFGIQPSASREEREVPVRRGIAHDCQHRRGWLSLAPR